MAINVNTNIPAMTAERYMNNAASDVQKSMERLSSGQRINSAKDDAAGLQISNRLASQSRGLEIAVRNANDGISIAQTAEGAMNETTNILQRMRDLSLQSSNGSNSKADRKAIQQEVTALNAELNRIAETTSFGGQRLLNGSFGNQSFQIGANSGEAVILTMDSLRSDTAEMGGKSFVANAGVADDWSVQAGATDVTLAYTDIDGNAQNVTITAREGDNLEQVATYINGQTDDFQASVGEDNKLQLFASSQNIDVAQAINVGGSLGIAFDPAVDKTVADVDVSTVAGSQEAVAVIDGSLKFVDSQRAALGAVQNRFDHAMSNLDNINENVTESRSRISDTDFAKETTALTKSQILQQASMSVLAQAQETPESALYLLS
ncbi:flagellin [Vibrio sp.]|nr:flagellin [Vibrio sp.]